MYNREIETNNVKSDKAMMVAFSPSGAVGDGYGPKLFTQALGQIPSVTTPDVPSGTGVLPSLFTGPQRMIPTAVLSEEIAAQNNAEECRRMQKAEFRMQNVSEAPMAGYHQTWYTEAPSEFPASILTKEHDLIFEISKCENVLKIKSGPIDDVLRNAIKTLNEKIDHTAKAIKLHEVLIGVLKKRADYVYKTEFSNEFWFYKNTPGSNRSYFLACEKISHAEEELQKLRFMQLINVHDLKFHLREQQKLKKTSTLKKVAGCAAFVTGAGFATIAALTSVPLIC